ncbi:uncharacterized protein LOC128983151 isoform X2 [Macrosteles quadrilineatus]|uniref:uncharacterized protein LOC128983151 isoform X2 n=1 Tax=Macrosteles quadrilineatus TaxID=74068 RepID=UPI0023E12181|nr:uncharacterized protein LOC128983151 isoform X2 [Macrosteles quadrilineatus]
MGTCFGRLKTIKKKRKRLCRLEHSYYSKNNDKVEEKYNEEIPRSTEISRPSKMCSRICSFFKPNSYKHVHNGNHLRLETQVDWPETKCDSPSSTDNHNVGISDSDNIQLVTLDVLSLRNIQPQWRQVSLTPPSSVDLEWESEDIVGNMMPLCQRRLLSTTEDCSLSSVVEGSPAESLEWDSGEGALDTDTEQLICEIERLTARALRETGGEWADR